MLYYFVYNTCLYVLTDISKTNVVITMHKPEYTCILFRSSRGTFTHHTLFDISIQYVSNCMLACEKRVLEMICPFLYCSVFIVRAKSMSAMRNQ